MKKLFVALTLMPLMALAETETVDGIAWTYTIIDGKAQIGTGSYSTAIPTTTTGEIIVPSSIAGCPVTAIGDRAFEGCNKLTAITIPIGVTNVGDRAFYWALLRKWSKPRCAS